MTFDESILYKDREQKVLEITKQVVVEVELEKSNHRDVEADTQPTPTEESEVSKLHMSRCKRVHLEPSGHQIGIHLHYTIYC